MLVRLCLYCGCNTDNPVCPECKEEFKRDDVDFDEILFEDGLLDHLCELDCYE